MSDLDEKLREILQQPHENSLGETVMILPTSTMLESIKAAFREDGWLSPEDVDKAVKSQEGFKERFNLMTGPEWLERFEEYIEWFQYEEDDDWRNEYLQAARRAAGVED